MKTGWLCLYLCICASAWHQGTFAHSPHNPIKVVYEWKALEFDYPTEADRQNAIDSGEFNAGRITPIDVDVFNLGKNNSRTFITVPRFQSGVPVTLGYVTNGTYNGNPIIAPYPSWEWNKNPSNSSQCGQNRVVSAIRVKIDECGRLWVLDDGNRVCPAQILAFDLETDQLVHRYEIPEDQLQSNSVLVTPAVDVRDPPPRGTCQDVFVYAADCQGMSIIVHDVAKNTSWKIVDKTFYPYPSYGTYHLAGETFDIMDGILGMDLSPYQPGSDRTLYYHALSSGTENFVRTSALRDQSLFADDPSPNPRLFHTYSHQRHTQCPAQAIDRNGVSYFGYVSDTSINCWNTRADYSERNIGELARNRATLQFASGVKVIDDQSSNKQDLWFITIRFQKLMTGTLNPNETNFRVQTANIDQLTAFSKCRRR